MTRLVWAVRDVNDKLSRSQTPNPGENVIFNWLKVHNLDVDKTVASIKAKSTVPDTKNLPKPQVSKPIKEVPSIEPLDDDLLKAKAERKALREARRAARAKAALDEADGSTNEKKPNIIGESNHRNDPFVNNQGQQNIEFPNQNPTYNGSNVYDSTKIGYGSQNNQMSNLNLVNSIQGNTATMPYGSFIANPTECVGSMHNRTLGNLFPYGQQSQAPFFDSIQSNTNLDTWQTAFLNGPYISQTAQLNNIDKNYSTMNNLTNTLSAMNLPLQNNNMVQSNQNFSSPWKALSSGSQSESDIAKVYSQNPLEAAQNKVPQVMGNGDWSALLGHLNAGNRDFSSTRDAQMRRLLLMLEFGVCNHMNSLWSELVDSAKLNDFLVYSQYRVGK